MSESNEITTQPKSTPSKVVIWFMILVALVALSAILISAQSRFRADAQFKLISDTVTTLSVQLTQKVNALQTDVATLKNSQHIQTQKTAAQISYLINLANLHLAVGHDAKAALVILNNAQQLAENNIAFSQLNQSLSNAIAALTAVPAVHVHQLFSEIADINMQIQHISSIPVRPIASTQDIAKTIKINDSVPWYQRIVEQAKQLKKLFVIRHLDEPSVPILASQFEMNLKQSMSAQLNMAQWALLHRDEVIYQASLRSVMVTLKNYFALSDVKNTIMNKLITLQQIQINPPLPSLDNLLSTANNSMNIGNQASHIVIDNTALQSVSADKKSTEKPTLPQSIVPEKTNASTVNTAPVET